MKKGCFLTFVIIFTVIVGIAVYIKKYKLNDVKNFAKEKLSGVVIDEFKDSMKKVKPSVYKDSLQNDLDRFFKIKTESNADSVLKSYGKVIDEAATIIKDFKIEHYEYTNFKNILAKYERSKKNGN
jgi:uncharacterized membrane protein